MGEILKLVVVVLRILTINFERNHTHFRNVLFLNWCINKWYYILGRKYVMLEMKVILSTILRHFKVNHAIAEKDWKLQADIVLKRADGYKISLESRKFVK